MTLSRLNLILVFAVASLLVLLLLLHVDNSRPNYQVNLGDDMTYSPAYGSYEANGNFTNGRTLQDPPPGTIARGAQLFRFEATPQDALRAGEQLENPFELGEEEGRDSADRGAAAFQTFCIACHGPDGTGNGPVAQRGFPPPPSLLTGKSREMKDGQLFHILTYGQNSMPQFAAQLPPERRWDVINYIRRLQQQAQPPIEPVPSTSAAVAEQETDAVPEAGPTIQPDSVAPAETESESRP